MVLPAAHPRSGKRGGGESPPEQGCRPGAEQNARSPSLGACRRSSPGCALSFWLPPLRPRACQGLGPGVRDSPRLLPRRGRSSRNAAFQSQGPREEAPLETALIRSPGREERPSDQDMPGGGRGKKKRDFQKIKTNAQKSPARSASETRHEPGDPPSPAALPKANSPGTHCSRSRRC